MWRTVSSLVLLLISNVVIALQVRQPNELIQKCGKQKFEPSEHIENCVRGAIESTPRPLIYLMVKKIFQYTMLPDVLFRHMYQFLAPSKQLRHVLFQYTKHLGVFSPDELIDGPKQRELIAALSNALCALCDDRIWHAESETHYEDVHYLLSMGARADFDFQSGSPLHRLVTIDQYVISVRLANIARMLVRAGCDVNNNTMCGNSQQSAIHRATTGNTVRVLHGLGADVNAADGFKFRLMHIAASNGRVELIDALRKCGAEIDPRDHENATPLLHTSTTETIRALASRGADVSAADSHGDTLLHALSVQWVVGNTSDYVELENMIRELIVRGANIAARNRYHRNPLDQVLWYRHDALYQKLLIIFTNAHLDLICQSVLSLKRNPSAVFTVAQQIFFALSRVFVLLITRIVFFFTIP